MEATITFRCNRCTGTITVPASKIGETVLCPKCYQKLTVPQTSTAPLEEVDPQEMYNVDLDIKDVREMGRWLDYRSVPCPRCKTSIAIQKSDCGKEIKCPDCDKVFMVPENAFDSSKDVFGKPVIKEMEAAKSDDIYNIFDSNIKPEKNSSQDPPEKKTFSVYCPLCATLMYATCDQIGETFQCPDCERKFIVRAPVEPIKKEIIAPVSFEGGTTYNLEGESSDTSAVNEKMIRIVCKHCGTMMYAPLEELGKTKKCPDCGFENPIINKTKEQELIDAKIQPNVKGEYKIRQVKEPDRPSAFLEHSFLLRTAKSESELQEEKKQKEREARKHSKKDGKNTEDFEDKDYIIGDKQYKIKRKGDNVVIVNTSPPRFAIFNGTLRPLFDLEFLLRFFPLLITSALCFIVGSTVCFPVFMGEGMNVLQMIMIIPSIFFVVSCIIIWLRTFPLVFLPLFQDSANGAQHVEEWMEEGLAGGLAWSGWIFGIAVISGIAPLLLILFTPNENGLFMSFIALLLFWIQFPIIFLSLGQTNGNILVWGIIKSLFYCFFSWWCFYLITLIFVGLPFFLWINCVGKKWYWFVGWICCNFLPMIYAVYLGRMAWIIEDNSRKDS